MNPRLILVLAGGLVGTAGALAQEASQAPDPPSIPVVKMPLRPTTAPVPALRYTLLPELRDTTPGNAALLYYRAFSPEWLKNWLQQEMTEALDKAQTLPLAELKSGPRPDALGQIAGLRNAHALQEVDRAARRQYCDWDLVGRAREDGISMRLPDVQGLRHFARMLAVRARLELADGNFDKATHTLQSGMQLGRHAADAPTLVQALVGIAIANVTLNQVEEFIHTPGSPNLYWALTALPHPFVDLRRPYQGERMLIDSLLPGFREALRDPSVKPLSGAQMEELALKFAQVANEAKAEAKTLLFAMALKKYSTAKEFLRRHGRTDEQISELPVLQAVMLFEVAEYDRLFDEFFKWTGQPYEVQRRGLTEADRALRQLVGSLGAPGLSLPGLLLPAVHKVTEAGVKLDRRICALRCVEAIRLHAAAHDGQLPGTLAAITAVPVPGDPMTGRPFQYEVSGGAATLTAPPYGGDPASAYNSFRYEITIVR
jgi:hypothetical protein